MFGVVTSDDYQPVGWVGRYPVRITTIIVAAFVLGMFATTIASTAHWDVIPPFAFSTRFFWHGSVWQPLTCVLIQGASFFFLFNVFFFYWAGVEVEKHLGRRRYLTLLGMLLLVPPIFLTCWSVAGVPWIYYGSYELSVGMFIAFATLYPNVELFGWVTLKWLAFAGLFLASMQFLPAHDWGSLSVLWGMCLAAFLYLRILAKALPFELPAAVTSLFQRRTKLRVVPRENAHVTEPEDIYDSIDPVLDKISKSGIGSLTASERRALDRARNRLLKKSS
jgi:membrane associated rhomboid family serine protease